MQEFDTLLKITNQKITSLSDRRFRVTLSDEIDSGLSLENLEIMKDLTLQLEKWVDESSSLNNGELVIAYATLGALVECWMLILLLCYNDQYQNSDKKLKKPLTKATLGELEAFFEENIIEDDATKKWIECIRDRRNAIHIFSNHSVGDEYDFISDIKHLSAFADNIDSRTSWVEESLNDYEYQI